MTLVPELYVDDVLSRLRNVRCWILWQRSL